MQVRGKSAGLIRWRYLAAIFRGDDARAGFAKRPRSPAMGGPDRRVAVLLCVPVWAGDDGPVCLVTCHSAALGEEGRGVVVRAIELARPDFGAAHAVAKHVLRQVLDVRSRSGIRLRSQRYRLPTG